ncbi:MAG: RNA polymerase sigma factor [Oscillospiraceae bacterium]
MKNQPLRGDEPMLSLSVAMLGNEARRSELAELFSEYSDRFYAIAFSKLHNRNDAEDCVIEAFARIAAKPERFFAVPREKRAAYLGVVIRNIAVDMYKKKLKYTEIEESELSAASPEEIVLGEISRDELVEFIRRLPDGKKDALILKILYDHSTAEIAEILGITETAARKRLSDARKMIREFVKGGADSER